MGAVARGALSKDRNGTTALHKNKINVCFSDSEAKRKGVNIFIIKEETKLYLVKRKRSNILYAKMCRCLCTIMRSRPFT